jgi:putative flavoprotein involved in K+ transport
VPNSDTVVIGAGHAGLAMSRCLADRGVGHVVLDRGCVGERWRTARWSSFRLLSPNWLTRLPGWRYTGPDPDEFMSAAEFVEYLSAYARSFDAPVLTRTPVIRVERAGSGFAVHTDDAVWWARSVVIATGYFNQPKVPKLAAGLSPDIAQVAAAGYRSPASLPGGGVLIVGGSATGVQIAEELRSAGRRVVVAVGSHTRLPRRYRGRDITWWLDRIGAFDRTLDQMPDEDRARNEPSLQLTGAPDGHRLDLEVLRLTGVQLVGRLLSLDRTTARYADDMGETVGSAQQRLNRLLAEIDEYAAAVPGAATGPPDPPPAITVPPAVSTMDLRHAGITSVVWATGYRPQYPWLNVPVLDADGRIRHRRGVTEVPGLYAIGLRFQHRRSSTFIDGARHDAVYLADTIAASGTRPVGVRHG